jgi:hypothetical protein
MPCWEIIESSVEFLPNTTDVTLLKPALESLGLEVKVYAGGLNLRKGSWAGYYESKTGKLELPASLNINEVKRQYSKHVVIATARKQGWSLSWSTNDQGNEAARVVKRRF